MSSDKEGGAALLFIVLFGVGVLVMVAAVFSHYLVFKGFAVLFVPGATLVYYLRERNLILRKDSGHVFPIMLSFVVSFFASGLNSQILTPHGLGTTGQQLLVAALSLVFSASAVILVELMLPDRLPASWAIGQASP